MDRQRQRRIDADDPPHPAHPAPRAHAPCAVSAPQPYVPSRFEALILWTALLVVLAASAGCSRTYYRLQADAEAYKLVAQKENDQRWLIHDYTIEPSSESRFFDPYSPDRPPMPPDDPAAHELMHYIDGKKNWPCWHANGDTPYVDNPDWRAFLPRDAQDEVVLDLDAAVATSRINSREYQTENENLYLSALDVSLQRFAFDTQFFGGTSLFFTSDGNDDAPASSLLELTPIDDFQIRRLFATGGDLVVGLANSFFWEFSGTNTETSTTLLNMSFIQPLLRGAGRAVVLNDLTTSERDLLAQVRSLVRFRREFYAQIATGAGGGSGGYLGLLQTQQEIRNAEANVDALRQSLEQIAALFEIGRVNRLQVDQLATRLYTTESALISQKVAYENRLDAYKIELGLPPDLPIRLDETLIAPFNLIDPEMRAFQAELDDLLSRVRVAGQAITIEDYEEAKRIADRLRAAHGRLFALVNEDYQRLLAALPERREALRQLAERPEIQSGQLSDEPLSIEDLDLRVDYLRRDIDAKMAELNDIWNALDGIERRDPATFEDDVEAQPLLDWLVDISGDWLELSLLQARARLDTIFIRPVDLTDRRAYQIALENRLDLMNERAELVDVWRQIEVTANDLRSGLDVIFEGEIRNTEDNPFRFRDKTGRLRVGFQFDAPLTRLAERNVYRTSLINFQRARRDYMAFTDNIDADLRSTLRSLRLNELNLELSRARVQASINQVEITQLGLEEPPRPEQVGQRSPTGGTTARDLADALTSLLVAQNDLLADWVDHEVQRVGLDLDMGTMRLDNRGMWIDPGENLGMAPVGAHFDHWHGDHAPGEPVAPPQPDEQRRNDMLLEEPLPIQPLPEPPPLGQRETTTVSHPPSEPAADRRHALLPGILRLPPVNVALLSGE